jgi:hypothetical protein
MMKSRLLLAVTCFATLAACGGGDGTPPPPVGPAALNGTVAYVATECIDTLDGATAHQQLRIIRGERPPMAVLDIPTLGAGSPAGVCTALGLARFGPFFITVGAFQRLAVSPDGSSVVFEVTDAMSLLPLTPIPPEQQGIFVMRTDGTGLRRLAPASREPTYRVAGEKTALINVFPGLEFSPNGAMVTYIDVGPGPDGAEATQIFALDLATSRRVQLTHLPLTPAPDPLFLSTCCPSFADNETVAFLSIANPDGLNPNGDAAIFTVKIDGAGLKKLPVPIVAPGSQIVPVFSITGPRPSAALFFLPGDPVNIPGTRGGVVEVFAVEGKNVLQLTNFHRSDTSTPLLAADQQHVLFVASANPFGTNPTTNCQIFSVDRNGADLQQISSFSQGDTSENGCFFGPPPGCAVAFLGQDHVTQTLVTYSSCDPLGANPYGSQIFALRQDGSGLRQLTKLRGLVATETSVTVELPGPFAFSTEQ